ncbi:uncharacterized protein [Anabrus simplex]|uniref:uncharacterized protein isoform X2 n=1 Tax=Anabrus simplex TaxID=316456 RepID=UPI0035A2803C
MFLIFRCILATLVALTFAAPAWSQDDEVQVEYAVRSLGDWKVPVKILQQANTKQVVPPADYQDGFGISPEDEPRNSIRFEKPVETYRVPTERRYFTRDLNMTREMLNSFGRRQLQPSSTVTVNKDNFHPLCQLEQTVIEFQHRSYEYRPSFYHELSCKKSQSQEVDTLTIHGKCAFPLLHCVQVYHELHIARRHINSTCWEPQTVVVKAGCECMWPEHELGSPTDHY